MYVVYCIGNSGTCVLPLKHKLLGKLDSKFRIQAKTLSSRRNKVHIF